MKVSAFPVNFLLICRKNGAEPLANAFFFVLAFILHKGREAVLCKEEKKSEISGFYFTNLHFLRYDKITKVGEAYSTK